MSHQPVAHPDWKAPTGDGEYLIWPTAEELLRQASQTHRRLEHENGVKIQNVPLAELRRRQRQIMGVEAHQPLIASGHQTELYHPGVWVKDVLSWQAAKKLGGVAYHIAVDTDHPKHITLRWPGGSAPITDDPRLTGAAWSGLLVAPGSAYLNELTTLLTGAAAQWTFSPLIFDFLAALARESVETRSLSTALTLAIFNDEYLGVRQMPILSSMLFVSPVFLAFAHHIIAHAAEFAVKYNAALAEYRRANGIKSKTRPMPDLAAGEDWCEIPFWQDQLQSQSRSRARVERRDGTWRLMEFAFDPGADAWEAADKLMAFLLQRDLRLSARALTLTLFARLLMADQFVHGIGGARYDQVTDALAASYFGIEPPPFCVTTATLYFPEAAGRSRVCLPCLQMEGHHLAHAVLGEGKKKWLERIAAAPRRSAERQAAFSQMHGEIAAVGRNRAELKKWEDRYEDALRRDTQEQGWFDRELFYAMQPKERLSQLIAKYESVFA
ncbi:MAG TPA: hypothetical protein VMD30_01020 [Tepidisphaeraceae bacterium]|nr:hypothetical protein [Tepidisphaeraceae bacterium]